MASMKLETVVGVDAETKNGGDFHGLIVAHDVLASSDSRAAFGRRRASGCAAGRSGDRRTGRIFEARTHCGSAGSTGSSLERHAGRDPDASGQTQTIYELSPEECMTPGRVVEMAGGGKRGKPNPGFPRFPPPLEIADAIPTFPQPRRVLFSQKTKPQKGGLASELRSSSRLILGLENAERRVVTANPEEMSSK